MLSNNSKIFVDTSAFYALLDRSDRYHSQASVLWPDLLHDNITLLTTNYVVWETVGLLQKRIGFEAASLWYKDILGVLDVLWVNARTHQLAYELWLNLGRRRLSLVDCVSYITINQLRVEQVFCFKASYADRGYIMVPGDTSILIDARNGKERRARG